MGDMEAASDDVTTTQQQPPPCDIVIDSSEINESNEGKCDDTDMQKDMKNLSIPDPEAAAAVVVVSNKKVEKVKSKKDVRRTKSLLSHRSKKDRDVSKQMNKSEVVAAAGGVGEGTSDEASSDSNSLSQLPVKKKKKTSAIKRVFSLNKKPPKSYNGGSAVDELSPLKTVAAASISPLASPPPPLGKKKHRSSFRNLLH